MFSRSPPPVNKDVIEMIEKATDEIQLSPDWESTLQICDIVNSQPAAAADVVKLLRKKINKEKKPQTQLLAIELMEALVKNCYCVVPLVADKDFQGDIVKLLQKKKMDDKVKFRLLDTVQVFSKSFDKTEFKTHFGMTYVNVQRTGIEFPPLDKAHPVFVPPEAPNAKPVLNRQSSSPKMADRLPEPKPVSTLSPSSPSSSSSVPSDPNALYELAKGQLSILIDMLNNNTDVESNELVIEFVSNCKELQPKVLQVIERNEIQNEGQLAQYLRLNDEMVSTLAKYERMRNGESFKPVTLHDSAVVSSNTQSEPLSVDNWFSSKEPEAPLERKPKDQSKAPTSVKNEQLINFFDDDQTVTSTTTQSQSNTKVSSTNSTNGGNVPLLSAPPPIIKTRNTVKRDSLTHQMAQLAVIDASTKNNQDQDDPFMAIAVKSHQTLQQQHPTQQQPTQQQPTQLQPTQQQPTQLQPMQQQPSAPVQTQTLPAYNPFAVTPQVGSVYYQPPAFVQQQQPTQQQQPYMYPPPTGTYYGYSPYPGQQPVVYPGQQPVYPQQQFPSQMYPYNPMYPSPATMIPPSNTTQQKPNTGKPNNQ